MKQLDLQYRKVINLYLEAVEEDLKDVKTREERLLALYLQRELQAIINDVEVKGLGK